MKLMRIYMLQHFLLLCFLSVCDSTQNYVINSANGATCENDGEPVLAQDECEGAAGKVGFSFGGQFSSADAYKGCSWSSDDKKLWFNTHSTGTSVNQGDDAHLVCRTSSDAATATVSPTTATSTAANIAIPQGIYMINSANDAICENGGEPVLAQDECEGAAAKVGSSFGGVFTSADAYKGCSWSSDDKKLWFNTHSTGTSVNQGDNAHLVCHTSSDTVTATVTPTTATSATAASATTANRGMGVTGTMVMTLALDLFA